jgi:hypothetical protein
MLDTFERLLPKSPPDCLEPRRQAMSCGACIVSPMAVTYLAIKLLHILLAIAALGANLTYGAWFARANVHPASAPFALRGVKFIDDWIANPAYLLLLPTGAAMVAVGHLSFGTHWISWAMGLWTIAILAGYFGYSPALRAQIKAVDAEGINAPRTKSLAVRGYVWSGILGILIAAILTLMVFKPS